MFPTAPDAFILNHSSLSRRVLEGRRLVSIISHEILFTLLCSDLGVANLLEIAIYINDILIYYDRSGDPFKAPPLLVDYCIKYFYLAIPSATSLFSLFEATSVYVCYYARHRSQVYCISGVAFATEKKNGCDQHYVHSIVIRIFVSKRCEKIYNCLHSLCLHSLN